MKITQGKSLYSLVVVSRDRPMFLARLLGYYASQGFRGQVLLSDASHEENRPAVDRVVAACQGSLDIAYSRCPSDFPLLQRIANAMEKVETPYLAWVGDDDFLVPAVLEAGAAYLDSHPDCAAVIGRALQFGVLGDGAAGKLTGLGDYQQVACEQGSALERLFAEVSHATAYTYALRRTETVNRNLALFDASYWPDDPVGYFFFETLDGLLTAIAGRVSRLERLMMLRQVHQGSAAAKGRLTQTLYRIVLHERWPQLARKAVDVLAAALKDQEPGMEMLDCVAQAERALCLRIASALMKGAKTTSTPAAGGMAAAKVLARQLLPRLSRRKAILLQRFQLSSRDFAELMRAVRLVESGGPT